MAEVTWVGSWLFPGTDARYTDLARGERFAFTGRDGEVDSPTFTKTGGGWYLDEATGRRYRTGSKVAIKRML